MFDIIYGLSAVCCKATDHTLRMKRSVVKLSGEIKAMTKMVTGCLSMTKVAIFVELANRDSLYHIKNMGICIYMAVLRSIFYLTTFLFSLNEQKQVRNAI